MKKATVMMIIDGKEYPYGTYKCDTHEELNRANEIALKVREERDCQTYLDIVEE